MADTNTMETIHVRQELRPARYACLVDPGDFDALMTAFSVNTAIWGGLLNPIVPSAPASLRDRILKSFDPEFVIDLSKSLPDDFRTTWGRKIVSRDDLVEEDFYSRRKYLNIGLGMIVVLNHIFRTIGDRLTGEQSLALPATAASGPWRYFVAASFGTFVSLPSQEVDYADAFTKATNAETVDLAPFVSATQLRGKATPISATAYGLRVGPGGTGLAHVVVYVGDVAQWSHLVEFWNIRATGRHVCLLPSENYTSMEWILPNTGETIRGTRRQYSIQRATGLSAEIFEPIAKWVISLLPRGVSSTNEPPFEPISDVGSLGIGPGVVVASTSEDISIVHERNTTPVKLLRPEALSEDDRYSGRFKWTVQIDHSSTGRTNERLTFWPRDSGLIRLIQRTTRKGPEEVRVGQHGLLLTIDSIERSYYPEPLATEEAFAALFSDRGFDSEMSQPGRCVAQVISKMGGNVLMDCRVFKIRGVRQILHKLSNGSVMTKGNMHDLVTQTTPDAYGANWVPQFYEGLILRLGQKRPLDFGPIFSELLDKRVIRPGFTFRCSHCFVEDWYHVSNFDEEYTCRFCFQQQRVNFASKREWQYKADGLFQIKDAALGSLAVIAAIWRLSERFDRGHGAYSASLNLTDRTTGRHYEIDYAFLTGRMLETSFELVFGEAAGYRDFEESDNVKMRLLADRFDKTPFLTFSTFKEQFSDYEKTMLKALAKDGYRVIALTRHELDPYDLFDRFEGLPNKYAVNLDQLAENTLRLNVNM